MLSPHTLAQLHVGSMWGAAEKAKTFSAAVMVPRWPNRGSWATAIILLCRCYGAAVVQPRRSGHRDFLSLPRCHNRGSRDRGSPSARSWNIFDKTTSLHLDLIYICLVCLGSFLTPKITLLKASWASLTSRYQDFIFKLQNHKTLHLASFIHHLVWF